MSLGSAWACCDAACVAALEALVEAALLPAASRILRFMVVQSCGGRAVALLTHEVHSGMNMWS